MEVIIKLEFSSKYLLDHSSKFCKRIFWILIRTMYEVDFKKQQVEAWEELIQKLENEEVAVEEKVENVDPSDIDSDWDQDDESLEAFENDEIDDLEALEKYFHHTKAIKCEYSQAKVWIEIAKELKWKSPELCNVITLLLCIPNGTSELERIFSVVKAMKTKKRSKLKASKLEKLLTIFYFLNLDNYDLNEVHQIFTELMR